MILIISDREDKSTKDVINWLNYYKKEWIILYPEDVIELLFNEYKICFIVNGGKKYNLDEIKSVWYRRGEINYKKLEFTNNPELDGVIYEEFLRLKEFFVYNLGKKNKINSIINVDINKLIISDKARKHKLKTPNDYLFSNVSDLMNFLMKNKHQNFITKSINGSCSYSINDYQIFNYTSKLSYKDIDHEDTFFHSLLQNEIKKKYEIRAFFLKDQFYSMAILSQFNIDTKTDYRLSNNKIKYIPYKLPNFITKKLNRLMSEIELDCGSIDLIYTTDNEYIFLEVNPIGQFSMVSYPCNYFLEKKIAEAL